MIKLQAEIDDIKYDEVIDIAIKYLQEGKVDGLPDFVQKLAGMSSVAAKMLLKKLPQGKKEELTAKIIQSKQNDIEKMLEHQAERMGIHLSVSNIKCKAV